MTITPLIRCMCGMGSRPPGVVRAGWWQIGVAWHMVVPGAHLARLVLAALSICVGYM